MCSMHAMYKSIFLKSKLDVNGGEAITFIRPTHRSMNVTEMESQPVRALGGNELQSPANELQFLGSHVELTVD